MEVVAIAAGANESTIQKKSNRIQVSNTKKPLFFYVNLAKILVINLSADRDEDSLFLKTKYRLAITTVVTIAEILKNNGLATEKKVLTSTVGMKDENKGRLVQKAKIEIVLGKSDKFDSLMSATSAAAAATNPEPTNTAAEAPTEDKD
ncbi:hypothetical protein RJ641_020510 [Dillenia turbinata]|uniref:DNA/RNA-binding protein Alba-like domain-containing protein n=1 Tax=Dillenia turbinata TaxID=194707 RepID=A0AAN8YZN2_9MAGN